MTPEEARTLVEQRLVDRKYLPALSGISLRGIAVTWTPTDWDTLADALKSGDQQNIGSALMTLVTANLAERASEEVQVWIDNSCVPPIRLVDLL